MPPKTKALVPIDVSHLPVVKADEKVIGMPVIRDPNQIINEARAVAVAVKQVIDSKPRQVIINGKRHIEFDDWQLLSIPYGVTAKVESTREIFNKDKGKKRFMGFWARAVAIKDGVEISAAEAECLVFERNWKYKAFNQRFMLRSMAQTRACAKVLSNVLRWVVVLAGYAATPAEEMYNVTATLPDNLYKPIKRILKRKPRLKKYVRKFLKSVKISSLKELSKSQGEDLITILNKH